MTSAAAESCEEAWGLRTRSSQEADTSSPPQLLRNIVKNRDGMDKAPSRPYKDRRFGGEFMRQTWIYVLGFVLGAISGIAVQYARPEEEIAIKLRP